MGESHRVLIVGGGGREHALAWRLGRDPDVERLIVAPGNPGIARDVACVPVPESDADALVALAAAERLSLAVVGPEAPLAAGLADRLVAAGIPTCGPGAEGARLESSKWAAKQVMAAAGVPTARARRCGTRAEALAALDAFAPPWVVKADGLAAGKGVLVSGARREVEEFLATCLEQGRFGAAGRAVVVEEFLRGEEASVMAVCDGRRFLLLPAARDHKRALDRDRGPNTGGMGAFAPTPAVDAALEEEVGRRIVGPVLEAMAARGAPYRGILYAGLMLTEDGPRVVEFNCRFGDPETQAVLPLLGGSLASLLASAAAGRLDPEAVRRERRSAVAVALVDAGYPERVDGGGTFEGLEDLMADGETLVFHAATAREQGRWRVKGGRALHVVGRGATLAAARRAAYAAVDRLGGSGWRCRRDIAAAAAATAAPARGAAEDPACR